MSKEAKELIACIIGFAVLAIVLGLNALPGRYYRYQNAHVYLVEDTSACWNGLRGSPCLEFKVPTFAWASSWKPSSQQIRQELARQNFQLDEAEIHQIIKDCIPCGAHN